MRDQWAHQWGSSLGKWDVRSRTTLEMVKGYIDAYILATSGGISYGEADMLLVDCKRADWVLQLEIQIDGLHLFKRLGA